MAFIYDLTDTWNAGGTTFNAIKMNVTDTASAAASKLITLQVGGSERFGVRKDGQGYFAGNVGIGTTAPNANLQIVSANTVVARLTTTGAATQASLSLGTVGGSATYELDQTGNLVARTQQGSMFFDNFSAGGTINFRTGGANTRMAITNTGDVGIGTSAPTARLQVVGASPLRIGTATDNFLFTGINTNVWGWLSSNNAYSIVMNSATGDVGIGTTAPERRLHVVSNQPLRMGTASDWFQFTQTNTNTWGWLSSSSVYALTMNGATGAIAVNTVTLDAAAQLQVDSTTRGFLPPRMTTTQRDAITTPPDGLVLYNTTTNKLQVRAAGAWVDLH